MYRIAGFIGSQVKCSKISFFKTTNYFVTLQHETNYPIITAINAFQYIINIEREGNGKFLFSITVHSISLTIVNNTDFLIEGYIFCLHSAS